MDSGEQLPHLLPGEAGRKRAVQAPLHIVHQNAVPSLHGRIQRVPEGPPCQTFQILPGGLLALTAAAAAGVEYHRLLRPASPLPAGSVVLTDAARAAAYLADRPGRVLLATGAKELPAFAALDPARLYPRVLPTLAGIAACEAAGIPHRNILAMQGPFTKELNAALLHQFHIDYMVTKDGGAAGGFAEKAEAAARCGVQLIVLRRPDDAGETTDTILQRCRELL